MSQGCKDLTRPTPFPCGSADKEPTCNVGDMGSIPGLERSSGEGKDYPLVFWPAVYTHIHNTCIYTYVCYHYYDSYGHM